MIRRPSVAFLVLAAGLLGAIVIAVGSGAFLLAPGEIAAILAHRSFGVGAAPDPLAASVLLEVRLPRVLLVALVGAGLATAGAALQGVLGNPLAEPGVLGLSAVAALASVATLLVLGPRAPISVVILFAALATASVLVLLVRLSWREGRSETLTLLLGGVAVNAAAVAAVTATIAATGDARLRTVGFWTFGSAAAADWRTVGVVLVAIIPASAVLFVLSSRLDLLTLGASAAQHLGVPVERTRRIVLAAAAALIASAVAAVGVVAFVGLLVPHAVRRLTGPAHRSLIPASAVGGALLLVLTDLAARTLFAPSELPLGTITSLLGAPLFLLLLRAMRDRQGGWI